ncbi:hypothetical protein ABS764_00575 [Flavobacterium sp. ST-87]|uniref:LTXXQ motif family protein n=1 Tax=Flavobacterium plantiphilum TaxID=3163297 RepID=A0ABW8XP71_9FLAO
MKKIIVLFSMIFITTISFGQNKQKNMRELRDSIFTVMKLSDANRQKMHDLIAETGKGGKAIKEDASLTEEQKKEKKKAFNKEMRAKQETILTPEQYQIWKDFAIAMRNKEKKQ